jgi:hypothetical protein
MLLLAIFLLLIIITGFSTLIICKKTIWKPAFLYIYLTLHPVLALWIVFEFTKALILWISDHQYNGAGQLWYLSLLTLEYLMIAAFFTAVYNAVGSSILSDRNDIHKDLVRIDKARIILKWSIYSNVVNILILTPVLILLAFSGAAVHALLAGLPGAIIAAVPLDAYVLLVMSAYLIIIAAVTDAFIINGTIRFLKVAKHRKGTVSGYYLLMIIPIANLITSIKLYKEAKMVLNQNHISI